MVELPRKAGNASARWNIGKTYPASMVKPPQEEMHPQDETLGTEIYPPNNGIYASK
jgi:hypothetical protein